MKLISQFLTLLVVFCLCHPVFAVVNGDVINPAEVSADHPFNYLVELNYAGQFGTGIYIGDGRILTAAHVFTLSTENLRELLPSVNIATIDNTRFKLGASNSEILFDPQSTTYLNQGNGRLFVQFNNDVAIVQITSQQVIEDLEVILKFKGIEIAEDVSVNDSLVGVGLYWGEEKKATTKEMLNGRDREFHFASLDMQVFEIQDPVDPQSPLVYKFYMTPEAGKSTEPGDSGGPVFKLTDDGQLLLAGVHHGRKPVKKGEELSAFGAAQKFSPSILDRFVNPSTDQWSEKVRPFRAEQILDLDDEIFVMLEKSLNYEQITWSHMPSLATEKFKKTVSKLLLNTASPQVVNTIVNEIRKYQINSHKMTIEDLKSSIYQKLKSLQ